VKLCLTTVVDQNYAAWIPLFVACAKKSYPGYDVRIYVRGTHQPVENAEIVQNAFKEYPDCGNNTIALRFLLPQGEFKNFDYVYITDIDMMIMKESVCGTGFSSLHEFHLKEMEKTGLTYSNSIRNSKHWKGVESLSGLHFCHRDWFDQIERSAIHFREYLRTVEVRREYDGHMLYLMVKDSGLGMPGKYKLVKRHHGIHMGNFRLFSRYGKLKARMGRQKCRAWMSYLGDEKFKKAYDRTASMSDVAAVQLGKFENHCKRVLA
jgi:hypothetical protein